jgi:hypothetical protein
MRVIRAVDPRHPNGFAMDIELVQKIVTPVAGYLYSIMEIGEGAVGTK